MKKVLFVFVGLISLISNSSAQKAERADLIKEWVFLGYEVSRPTKTMHDYSIVNGYFAGPSVDLLGIMNLNIQRGYFEKPDTNSTLYIKAYRYSANFNGPIPVFKFRNLNIVPFIGVGVYGHKAVDPYTSDSGMGDEGFGFSANGGVSVIFGPIKLSGKCYAEAGYNPKGSIWKGAKIVPAISLTFAPSKIFLNPQNFSYRGMATWRENYKKDTRTSTKSTTEYDSGVEITTTTTTTSVSETWDQVYGEKGASISDTQPFLFIGPRVGTSFLHFSKDKPLTTVGATLGFRYGTFYMAGNYDKGDFYFREPYERKDDGTASITERRAPRLDGFVTNSSRMGGEIGFDLVTFFVKSQFLDKSAFASKTSYYSLMVRFGYNRTTLGELEFNNDSASVFLDQYFLETGELQSKNTDVRMTDKTAEAYNIGMSGGVGAFVFNWDFYMHKNQKSLNHPEFTISYNFPIARLVKSIGMFAKLR
jgi:hypothetical protein